MSTHPSFVLRVVDGRQKLYRAEGAPLWSATDPLPDGVEARLVAPGVTALRDAHGREAVVPSDTWVAYDPTTGRCVFKGATGWNDFDPFEVPHEVLPLAIPSELLASRDPRRFYLDRHTDVTGASGTGRVADGVLWPDGTATLRWRGQHQSTVHWDNIESAERVHGHDGRTKVVFLDFDEDSRVAELEQLRTEITRLRAGEEPFAELAEGVHPTPGQWLAKWNGLSGVQRLRRLEGLLAACDEAEACRRGQHETLHEELVGLARRLGAAQAVLALAVDALDNAPQSCRYHGTEFEKGRMRRGLPVCDSCKQPFRVKRALDAIRPRADQEPQC